MPNEALVDLLPLKSDNVVVVVVVNIVCVCVCLCSVVLSAMLSALTGVVDVPVDGDDDTNERASAWYE